MVVKSALVAMHPLAFNCVRLILASAILLGIIARTERDWHSAGRDLGLMVAMGLVGHTVFQLLFISGLSLVHAGKTAVLLALSPAIVALYGRLTAAEKYGWGEWFGIGCSLVGVGLVTARGQPAAGLLTAGDLKGELLVVGAAVCWAGYTIGTRPLLKRHSALKVTALTMVYGTVPLVLASLGAVRNQDWRAVPGPAWAALVCSSLFALVLAYTAWGWGIKRIGSGHTAVFANLNPIVASLVGWILLKETWSPLQVLGATLVIFGVTKVRSATRPVRGRFTTEGPKLEA